MERADAPDRQFDEMHERALDYDSALGQSEG